MTFCINYLTKVHFGQGAIESLITELKTFDIKAPLVVTDKGLMDSGLIQHAIDSGGLSASVPIFADTPPNPTEEAVEHALQMLLEYDCDGIVAIGGGSSIDLAKGVSLLATHEAPLRQYALIEDGAERITSAVIPLIAIPTTAGTGSEVGRGMLITMHDKRKLGFISPHLIPSVALCDPDMTASLPRHLTAATGMDAIAHCVETFLSPRENPPAEAIALDGLKRAVQNIHIAVEDGHNTQARSEMMMAALEGALAFQKGLGAVHSLSHALGGFHELELHHGTLNAILLPAVLRFNQSHCEEKYVRLRDAIGVAPDTNVAEAFAGLNRALGLPTRLNELGVPYNILDQVALWACEDHSTTTNPRLTTKEDFHRMLLDTF